MYDYENEEEAMEINGINSDVEEITEDDCITEDPCDEGYQMSDVEADADTLASAGMGTDEDYGYYGENE